LGAYLPDGKKTVWLKVNGTPIYDSRGDISEVVISFIDITREREQLKEIETSRQRLSNILESTNVGTWEWNIQTGEMIYNERWAQMLGYTLDEIAPVNSQTFLRFVHPEDAETGKKIRMEVFEKELVRYDIEIRIKHKDGSWVWVQDRGMVTSWTADGKPLTMSGTHSDITQRKEIEIELQKTTLQNQRILDRLQDAYFQVDLSGIIRIANPAAASIFGYPSNREMLGLPAVTLYADPKDRERLYGELKKKGEIKDYDFLGLRADGTSFSCSTHVQIIRDDEGKINGVESLCRDITEYKKLEEGIKRQRDILEESNKKLEHMLEQSVNAISRIGELRDAYTAGHQRRVQELSCAIARYMGLSEEDIVILSYGALIHDIGKIYISSDILNKPGKITDLEYQILQTHAEYGYNVINSIDFPERIPMMVHQHHERMDGSGYPQGLQGDQIILESRILAVADVVEAMTSQRPYRAALGLEAALDEIMLYKGSKYDEAVVTSCVHLFKEKIFSFLS
jgi:PAS domain S-box-containing protein/putative nucleotidyltransferase with HDIG domain